MSTLKPIGSEKLQGQDKLKRIMEIARFNETMPNSVNETSKSEYSVTLADGNNYQIVRETKGYIIKKSISESQTDYIEPMKNRKYFSSYSQAFKRLNLLAGELNRINENEEGVALFGEQKKFVLKTPKPEAPAAEAPAPSAEPPAVPSPELPPSPVDAEAGVEMDADMGGEMDDEMGSDMGVEMDAEVDTEVDVEEPSAEDDVVTFKSIQKLTGKLTQKIRTLQNEEGMTSEDIKYVINMVLSSFDLGVLSEEDREDILSKFEDVESKDEMGDEGEVAPEEDITSDTEVEDIQADMDVPVEGEMEENWGTVARIAAPMVASYVSSKMAEDNESEDEEVDYGMGAILDGIFGESKVDKVISKYFELTKKEILESKEKNIKRRKNNLRSQFGEIMKLSETIEQELASKKFLEENSSAKIVGKTNKKNLVFEHKGEQVRISPKGILV